MLGEKNFDMKMVIRHWTEILPEWEFRAFVKKKKLTSCTQYYQSCFVPEFVTHKQRIQECIFKIFDEVKDKIKLDDYTIDFALSPLLEEGKIWIVELNHVPPTAGTSLFDWANPKDRDIIENGPFELRVLSKPVHNAKGTIHPPLRRLINEFRGIDDLIYERLSHLRAACNVCRRFPITETWYRCTKCRDYDICTECDRSKHFPNEGHTFVTQVSCDTTSKEAEKDSRCIIS